MYVGKSRAEELGIAKVVTEKEEEEEEGAATTTTTTMGKKEEFVYMSSSPNDDGGMRDSVRLEGKTRFNRGLFLLDVRHMPDGCGVWPAFWMTDEANWPRNGEVDILEGEFLFFHRILIHFFCRSDDDGV